MRISVVIPCRNEASHIERCIGAVFSLSLPALASMQVFVVDGMSSDGSRELIQGLQLQFDNLQLIDNEILYTPAAFNLGIKADPSADYILIVGARHILSNDYLIKALEILEADHRICCVGGRIINEHETHLSGLIAAAMGSSFGMGIGNFRTLQESGFTDTVTSPVYRSSVFSEIGYFDENLVRNQDDDFNFRLTRAGGKIWYEHSISLRYYVRSGYGSLSRQFFQYGYWKVFVNRKHRAVTTLRQLIPPAFVIYLVSLVAAALFLPKVAVLYAIPLLLYLLLAITVSLLISGALMDLFRLLRIFGLIHLSYGFGYIRGLLDFILLSRKPDERMKTLSR